MKRKKFERHLTEHGCSFDRHGGNHDTWWNTGKSHSTSVPRHNEIDPGLIRDICRQLGIPPPREK